MMETPPPDNDQSDQDTPERKAGDKPSDFHSVKFRDSYQDMRQPQKMHGCLKWALIAGAVMLLLVSACFGLMMSGIR
jgi:hypothetical protein